jgi:mono/diheme cytochrome c family protein
LVVVDVLPRLHFLGGLLDPLPHLAHRAVLAAGVQQEQAVAAALEEQRAANSPITEESLQSLAKNPVIVEEGRKIFQDTNKCALCHKADGGGIIGPNLTDDMWIYGGTAMDIYTSILKGRPGGMLAHEASGTTVRPAGYRLRTVDPEHQCARRQGTGSESEEAAIMLLRPALSVHEPS